MRSHEEKLEFVKSCVQSYPDFPKKGVLFRDIFSVMLNSEAFSTLMDLIVEHVGSIAKPDAVVGLESRGFLFGPFLALRLGVPFVPIRKKGKLPGDVLSFEYTLEYSSDVFEIQKNSLDAGQSVLIVDDLLATGGSMKAACELLLKLGISIIECFTVIELLDLKGRAQVPATVNSLIRY